MSQEQGNRSKSTSGGNYPPARPTAVEPEEGAALIARAQGQPARVKLGVLLTVVLLGVGWFTTFSEMWLRWYPAWITDGYSVMQRLSEGDSYYSHGPLVPLVSLIITVLIFKRVGLPARRSTAASRLGWVLFVGSLALHLLSMSARVTFVSGFALVGVLGGLVLIWGGFTLARAYWLPIAFLLFMVPLPMETIAALNFRLKFFATESAMWLTNHLFRIPAFQDGSYVILPRGADGAPKTLVVENVCGGLRSLISLVCFASLFALVCRVKRWWRLLLLAMAVPVALACNIVRITALNVVAHHFSIEAASPSSWFHDISGLAVFIGALALLFGLEFIIIKLGDWFKRDWTDMRLLAYLDPLRRVKGDAMAAARPSVLVILVAAAGLSLYYARQAPAQNQSDLAKEAVPTSITIDDKLYTSQDLELDQRTLTILETDDYLYRRFTHAPSRRFVDMLIVFSKNNRKGTHPPEVCLQGSGEQVVAKKLQTVALPVVGEVDKREVDMRELITQKQSQQTYYLYTYKSGDSYTPNFFVQQFTIFFNGLIRSRNTAGALIRITTSVQGTDEQAARSLALGAARILMPEVDKRLP